MSKRPTIEFPCGCVVNATHVVAMCLPHDKQLREAGAQLEGETHAHHRELLKAIESLK